MRLKLINYVLIIGLVNIIECSEPKVTLKHGTVIGLSETINGKNVNVFLGIPYAKPPLNELRFRKPQPLTEKWQTTVQATKWPSECIQIDSVLKLPTYSTQSEDCLFLNIWSPVDLQADFTNKLKPVMVWIHGGSFTFGSISFPYYNASVLSTVGDVVVVTVNYRLGALGFMFGGSDEMPGNMGLYDQALALEWVQDNIAYFGGDKDLVTLFGESAGSMGVVYHLTSPISKSYKNAIAMSGVATDYFLTTSTATAKKIRNNFAKFVDCESNDADVISESTLQCLRKVDAAKFSSTAKFEFGSSEMNSLFLPVFGEAFIPKNPKDMWKDKIFNKNINVLLGLIPNEGMVMEYEGMDSQWDTDKTGEQMMRDHLANRFISESVTLTAEDIEEIIKFYFSGIPVEKQRDTYLLALGDLYLNCPKLQFASGFSETNKVYQYLLDFKANFKLMETLKECKVCKPELLAHADDLPFTFGTSPNEDDTEITLRWIKIITDFAKTGKTSWPSYYKTKYGDLITKYYHIKNTEEESDVRVGYRQAACEMWSEMLDV